MLSLRRSFHSRHRHDSAFNPAEWRQAEHVFVHFLLQRCGRHHVCVRYSHVFSLSVRLSVPPKYALSALALNTASPNSLQPPFSPPLLPSNWLQPPVPSATIPQPQSSGPSWKESLHHSTAAPWVRAVMANGFRTPPGCWAVAGLMGCPLWLWTRR